MSIVIAVIDQILTTLYLYGDKRRTTEFPNGTKETFDDFQKVGKLKENLFCGVTGVVSVAASFLNQINKKIHLSNDDIIEFANNLPLNIGSNTNKTTVILAGSNNTNQLFIWSKGPNDSTTFQLADKLGDIVFAIAHVKNESYNVAYKSFTDVLMRTNMLDYDQSIKSAIQNVSKIDETVSACFDCFHYHMPTK